MRFNILILLALILAVSCNSQTIHKYDIIELTDSAPRILKTNVHKNEIKHSFYIDRKYQNGKIVSIEYRDTLGRLFNDNYNYAVLRVSYDRYNRVCKVETFDSLRMKLADGFSEIWSTEYQYDRHNRIIKIINRDTSNNYVTEMDSVDYVPAWEVYKYVGDSTFVSGYSKSGKVYYQNEFTKPPNLDYLH